MKRDAFEKMVHDASYPTGLIGTTRAVHPEKVIALLRTQHRAFVRLVKRVRQSEVDGLNMRHYIDACDHILATLAAQRKGGKR